jgi:hypothetical protein
MFAIEPALLRGITNGEGIDFTPVDSAGDVPFQHVAATDLVDVLPVE